jgi:hypothetical protein
MDMVKCTVNAVDLIEACGQLDAVHDKLLQAQQELRKAELLVQRLLQEAQGVVE